MRRLSESSNLSPSRIAWPNDRDYGVGGRRLYEGRPRYRKMVVMVDIDLIDGRDFHGRAPSQRSLLVSLLRREELSAFLFDESASLLELPWQPPTVGEAPKGLLPITVGERADGQWPVRYAERNGTLVDTGVWGNAVDVAFADRAANAHESLSDFEAANRRAADALVAEVASQALGADLLISERPYLAARPERVTGTTLCSLQESLAALGLYFRAQGSYPVGDLTTFNRGLFYWVGARELLAEGWRLTSSTSQSDEQTGSLALAHSVIQRIARALEHRDVLNIALNQPQDNDTLDTALSALDSTTVSLMSAFDAMARVAHRTLMLDGSAYDAAWQRKRWLGRVQAVEPRLAATIDTTSDGFHLLTILRLLRNSVHGEALRGLTSQTASTRQSLVMLPEDDLDEVLTAVASLGGKEAWGIQPLGHGKMVANPSTLADRLCKGACDVLNDLIAAVPLESLPGVNLTTKDCAPPETSATGGRSPFNRTYRESIRWQLGF